MTVGAAIPTGSLFAGTTACRVLITRLLTNNFALAKRLLGYYLLKKFCIQSKEVACIFAVFALLSSLALLDYLDYQDSLTHLVP